MLSDIVRDANSVRMANTYVGINKSLTEMEMVFNGLACLPIIGIVSSSLRLVIGLIQSIVGALLYLIASIALHICRTTGWDASRWQLLQLMGKEQLLHGSFNMARSLTEFSLAALTLGIVTSVFNLKREFPFQPLCTYCGVPNQVWTGQGLAVERFK